MGQEKHPIKLRWILLLILALVWIKLLYFPAFDQEEYLRSLTTPPPDPLETLPDPPQGWPETEEEALAIYFSTRSERTMPYDGYCLDLTPNSTQAVYNGEPVTLAAPPLMSGDTLLIPGEEVLALLGGTLRYQRETGRVRVFLRDWNGEDFARYFDGTMNWETYAPIFQTESQQFFSTDAPSPEGEDPQFIQGRLYIPISYLESSIYQCVHWLPGERCYRLPMVRSETAAEVTCISDNFQDIPFEVAKDLHLVRGSAFNLVTGDLNLIYGNDDIRITCEKPLVNDFAPEPYAHKRVIRIQLLTDRYASSRGIRIGDPEEKVLERYGLEEVPPDGLVRYEQYLKEIQIKIRNHKVVSIVCLDPNAMPHQ